MSGTTLRVDVWSDVVCPWCYVGAAHLKHALDSFEHAADVEIVWRSFELDPHAPLEREGSYISRLARKYGVGEDEARHMVDRIVAAGTAAGLDMRFDIARAGNTFDAHRLLHHAFVTGGPEVQGALKDRLFRAYFTDGLPIFDRAVLASLADEMGVAGAADVLGGDSYASEVRADEAEASAMGVSGVPFFLVDGAYGLAGAHPPENLRRVLERAWSERAGA